MNPQRDIERVLDAWFVDGSSRMPDRLFDAVLDEVGRMPQRRRPWSNRKVRPMSLQVRLAAAAAVIVLIGGAGLAILNGRPATTNVGVTPPPSVALSPKASDAALPPELEYRFLAPRRTAEPIISNQDRAIASFIDAQFEFNDRLLQSTASSVAADRVRLVSTTSSGGCEVGDEGIYSWSLSPGGTKLTLTLIDDACATRAAVVAGDDWIRSDCPNPENSCLGNLEAGTYSSQYIDPYVATGSQWYARFGALTYTVPEGWQNTADYPTTYLLQPQGATDDSGIHVYSEVALSMADEACTELPQPGLGRTAEDFATYLSGHEGVLASDPIRTTIGGLTGFTMLLEIDPGWTRSCPFVSNGAPVVPLFTDPDDAVGGLSYALGGDTRIGVYLLNLPEGRSLLIAIEAHGPDWQALIDEATPIVESMQFPR